MIYVYNVKITNNNFCLGKKGEIFIITKPIKLPQHCHWLTIKYGLQSLFKCYGNIIKN
jgi:hypothetical protein